MLQQRRTQRAVELCPAQPARVEEMMSQQRRTQRSKKGRSRL